MGKRIEHLLYRAYSDYLKEKYGEKVYKLPVNLPLSCPNRDGTCGMGGCIFCGQEGAGHESLPASMSVTEQISINQKYIAKKYKAQKFIPYFQNFSNTYLPFEKLSAYLVEAINSSANIVALSIATRPDCLHEQHLELFDFLRKKYQIDITVELGLQTVNYHSLSKINRGHSLAEFVDAIFRIKTKYPQIRTCAQLILNLPWDDRQDTVESAKILSALLVDEVKLHALYVVKGTLLAKWYEQGEISLDTKDDYIERVIIFLEHLKADIVIGRLIGRAPSSDTVFANWGRAWWKIREEIEEKMRIYGTYQGSKCNYLNGCAVEKYLYPIMVPRN